MGNWRFDRSRILIGTYCRKEYASSETHVRMLADAGIDYICSAPADQQAQSSPILKSATSAFHIPPPHRASISPSVCPCRSAPCS